MSEPMEGVTVAKGVRWLIEQAQRNPTAENAAAVMWMTGKLLEELGAIPVTMRTHLVFSPEEVAIWRQHYQRTGRLFS